SAFPAAGLGTTRPVLVKVVDFGLARLQTSSATNTLVLQNERSFIGTPAYISPEQARNIHEVDIRADLYSLGCTFYHALTGRLPLPPAAGPERRTGPSARPEEDIDVYPHDLSQAAHSDVEIVASAQAAESQYTATRVNLWDEAEPDPESAPCAESSEPRDVIL